MFVCLLCLWLLGLSASSSLAARQNETAVTRSSAGDGITPMYYEPSAHAPLFGEYFDGVTVSVCEVVSNEWVRVDIHTYGDGGTGYIMRKDLAFGQEAENVAKLTVFYESSDEAILLATHPFGQSGDLGPFDADAGIELLGLAVRYHDGMLSQAYQRPLLFEQSILHVKIGDVTGFLYDGEGLRSVEKRTRSQ